MVWGQFLGPQPVLEEHGQNLCGAFPPWISLACCSSSCTSLSFPKCLSASKFSVFNLNNPLYLCTSSTPSTVLLIHYFFIAQPILWALLYVSGCPWAVNSLRDVTCSAWHRVGAQKLLFVCWIRSPAGFLQFILFSIQSSPLLCYLKGQCLSSSERDRECCDSWLPSDPWRDCLNVFPMGA